MITRFDFLATAIIVVLLTSSVNAQFGGTGSTTTGSNTGGGISGLGSTTSSGTGSSATGSSSGTSGLGSSTTGVNGTSTTTDTGNITLQSNAAQSFVGSNATQGFVGGATQGENQQQTNRQFQAIQNNNQQTSQQQTGTPRAIKATLRVGFVFQSAPQLNTAGRLANANVPSMNRFIPDRPDLAGIDVNLNSLGVAVLTGSVTNIESQRLAANLMRLQPGVRKVDNQIVVQAE